MSNTPLHIGFDAKRIVRNGTGLGAYGRTLVNDLAQYPLQLSLYAPNKGRDDLRTQIVERDNVAFHYPHTPISHHLSSCSVPTGVPRVSLPILSATKS